MKWISIVTLVLLTSCKGGPNDNFSRNLKNFVERGAPFRLSEATDFPWTKVYVYGPYDRFEAIDKKHKTKLTSASSQDVPEGDCLYIFEDSGTVVHTAFFPRGWGDCTEIARTEYTSEIALFEAKKAPYGEYTKIIWKQTN